MSLTVWSEHVAEREKREAAAGPLTPQGRT
jgi:hypothetical protein